MEFYERLTKLMKEKGYSQAKLEKEIGISNGSVSKWKTHKPAPETLNKVANALGVTIQYLMGWGEEDNRLVTSGNPLEHLKLASMYEKLSEKKKKDIFEIMELLENADDDKIAAIKMLLK